MSRHFEEAKLVITADIAYDPDTIDHSVCDYLSQRIEDILKAHEVLNKNINVELQGFICDGK
jgi:hypothetical protein